MQMMMIMNHDDDDGRHVWLDYGGGSQPDTAPPKAESTAIPLLVLFSLTQNSFCSGGRRREECDVFLSNFDG
jgi:hypothetical protein